MNDPIEIINKHIQIGSSASSMLKELEAAGHVLCKKGFPNMSRRPDDHYVAVPSMLLRNNDK